MPAGVGVGESVFVAVAGCCGAVPGWGGDSGFERVSAGAVSWPCARIRSRGALSFWCGANLAGRARDSVALKGKGRAKGKQGKKKGKDKRKVRKGKR